MYKILFVLLLLLIVIHWTFAEYFKHLDTKSTVVGEEVPYDTSKNTAGNYYKIYRPTVIERALILDLHNTARNKEIDDIRSKLYLEQIDYKLTELTYRTEIEADVADYLSKCNPTRNFKMRFKNILCGQNLQYFDSKYTGNTSYYATFKRWINTDCYYLDSYKSCILEKNQYFQIIRDDIKYVGCSKVKYTNGTIVACNYCPDLQDNATSILNTSNSTTQMDSKKLHYKLLKEMLLYEKEFGHIEDDYPSVETDGLLLQDNAESGDLNVAHDIILETIKSKKNHDKSDVSDIDISLADMFEDLNTDEDDLETQYINRMKSGKWSQIVYARKSASKLKSHNNKSNTFQNDFLMVIIYFHVFFIVTLL